jgi:hypothetical protein
MWDSTRIATGAVNGQDAGWLSSNIVAHENCSAYSVTVIWQFVVQWLHSGISVEPAHELSHVTLPFSLLVKG